MYRFNLFVVLFLCFFSTHASSEIWLLVDTSSKTLEVKRGPETVDVFANIAIGRAGSGNKARRGDNITPLGTYRIAWVNRDSQFRLFFGFDYPSLRDAQKALHNGSISRRIYNSLVTAHQRHLVPMQNTFLGGLLGIHGLGHADARVHKYMDWTRGCIALTNTQIDRLDKWIAKGTVVEIK